MSDSGHEQPPAVDVEAIARAVADRVTDQLTERIAGDLSPIQTALAEVIDALAFQIDESRSTAASTLAAMEVFADRVDGAGHVDLEPIRRHLAALPGAADLDALRHHIDSSATDLDPVTERIDALAATLAASREGERSEPVDLRPVQAQLDAILDRTDPAPLHDRLDEMGRHLDLGPIRAGIAEVVEATAVQLEATERTATELGRAIADATDRTQAVDLAPIVDAVDAFRQHYDATQPDLSALIDAMVTLRAQIVIAIREAAVANRVDLGPVLTEVTEQRAGTDEVLHQLRTELGDLAEAVRTRHDDARASLARIESTRSARSDDLEPLLDAINELRESMPSVELQPLHDQFAELARQLPPPTDLTPIHAAIDALASRIPGPTDLTPIEEAIDEIASRIPGPTDLSSVRKAIAAIESRIPGPTDLSSLHAAIADLAARMPDPPDLASLHAAIADLAAAMPSEIDAGPIRDDLAGLRDAISSLDLQALHDQVADVRRSMPVVDLAPVTDAIDAVRADLPTVDLEPVLVALEAVGARVDGIELDTEPIRREIDSIRSAIDTSQADLTPVLEAMTELERRLDDTSDVDRITTAVDRLTGDLAGTRSEMARSEMARSETVDQLARRLDGLQSAVDSLRSDESLHEAERRLTRRVDSNSEALRARIDDQRVLADSLAANVSQLNAALTVASEEPQQLRRDLDRILEQLAERMGGAMRELRNELKGADEPLALRSSVEAGLDRITGRFQSDTGRILEAVASAQEDADGRLRRIDNQVTELRRAVERVRRDNEGFPSVSSS